MNSWRIGLVGLGLLAAILPATALADELVVDDGDASVQLSGAWASTSLTAGFVGVGYHYSTAGNGSETAVWPFPAGAQPGRYEVYARWTSGPNRAGNAPYDVVHAGGSSRVAVSQREGGGDWQRLGTFDVAPGQGHGVRLNDGADGVVVADAVRWVGPLAAETPAAPASPSPAAPAPAESAPAPPPAEAAPAPADVWTVTLSRTDIHAGPNPESQSFGTLAQFSYLKILGYEGAWAYVYNPRTRGPGWVRSNQLGPSDPPPPFVTAPSPPPEATIDQLGRTVGSAPLAFYPIADQYAYETRLGHNVPVHLVETVRGADGEVWYRAASGGYLQASSVRLPTPPPRTFAGRWLDVELSEPSLITAYEGDQPVRTMLAIHGVGRWQTPKGLFSIQRRVANETMDSSTLGIPRNGPGGYYLPNVLYTQYFLPTGESLHYNYWSSNFGYAGSHGCLGLSLADSEFLWNFATLGTPVLIR